MERPSELRATCQAGKRADPPWYTVHRKISIYITWVFLWAKVPPTLVSLLMMGLGLGGATLLISSIWHWNLLGFVLLYGSFLLDKVDGEIARYRHKQTVRGIFLDRLHHRFVEPCLYVAVALHEIRSGAPGGLLAAALLTALLANIIEEHQQLAPFILIKHLRETGQVPQTRAGSPGLAVWPRIARLLRPLKLFRTFIVGVPAFAVCYAVEGRTGRFVPALYLVVGAAGLFVYSVFQSIYYFHHHLDSEIAAILERFPGLQAVGRRPPSVLESMNDLVPEGRESRTSRRATQSPYEHSLTKLADHALSARAGEES